MSPDSDSHLPSVHQAGAIQESSPSYSVYLTGAVHEISPHQMSKHAFV